MLKLVPLANGHGFDLAYDDPAIDDVEAAVATVVYAFLGTDAEVPAGTGRVDDAYDRRGWCFDKDDGNGLWHVRRQALTPEARRETLETLSGRMEASNPALTKVKVSEVTPADPAGNISSVFLEVTGFHNGREFVVRAAL